MRPAILPGGSGIKRSTDMAVTDLPQPDSPTIASVCPASIASERPSTARLMPSGVRKCVCRLSISSSAMAVVRLEPLGHSRVEGIAQPVTQQIHGKHGEGKED